MIGMYWIRNLGVGKDADDSPSDENDVDASEDKSGEEERDSEHKEEASVEQLYDMDHYDSEEEHGMHVMYGPNSVSCV